MIDATIFLPGILMPAAPRYAPLLAALGDAVSPVVKDLEVYRGESVPPDGYSIETEIAGIDRAADEAKVDRFHLYGHSGGGAVAIAYAARRGERVLSLALDEPASDFSDEALEEVRSEFLPMLDLPLDEMTRAFIGKQLRAGAPVSPPAGPPPPWMETRPAGIRAFIRALAASSALPVKSDFSGPVYYSYGNLSHESWIAMRDRLSKRYTRFASEEYVGSSHMKTSHMTEPSRVAAALRRLWGRDK